MYTDKQYYSLGFLFDITGDHVVLIEKNKPEWQNGLLNGVGGHIEDGESPLDAMVREFREETSVETLRSGWDNFCVMTGYQFEVHCFKYFCTNSYMNAKTSTSESLVKIYVGDLGHHEYVSNLPWLIPMALDKNLDNPFMANILY